MTFTRHNIVSFIVLCALVASFVFPAIAFAQTNQEQCVVTSAQVTPFAGDLEHRIPDAHGYVLDSQWYDESKNSPVLVRIETNNCKSKNINVSIVSTRADGPGNIEAVEDMDNRSFTIDESEGIYLEMMARQEWCWGVSQADRTPVENDILAILANDKTGLTEYMSIRGFNENQELPDDYFNNYIVDFVEEYDNSSIIESHTGWDFYTHMVKKETIGDKLGFGVLAGIVTYATGGLGGIIVGGIGYATAEDYERGFVEALRGYLNTRLNSVTFTTPCDYYVSVTADGTTYDFDDLSDRLRFHCDPDTNCSTQRKWVFIDATTNIGGVVLDATNPCYDPSARNNRKENCQELLAPLPGFGDRVDENLTIGVYVNTIIQMLIGFMGMIAVLMLIYAGVRYMTVDSTQAKSGAKDMILNAFIGILIAAGSYIILRTINPALLNIEPQIRSLTITPDVSEYESGLPANTTLKLTKTDNTIVDILPCDTSNFVMVDVFGTQVQFHKDAAPYLEQAWENVQASGVNYPIKSIGGYACRTVAGNSNSVSKHSYGIVVDINPEENPFVKFVSSLSSAAGSLEVVGGFDTKFSFPFRFVGQADKAGFVANKDNYSDMPQEFIDAFIDAGFGWGGNWNSSKDAMHFSLYGGSPGGGGGSEQGTKVFLD